MIFPGGSLLSLPSPGFLLGSQLSCIIPHFWHMFRPFSPFSSRSVSSAVVYLLLLYLILLSEYERETERRKKNTNTEHLKCTGMKNSGFSSNVLTEWGVHFVFLLLITGVTLASITIEADRLSRLQGQRMNKWKLWIFLGARDSHKFMPEGWIILHSFPRIKSKMKSTWHKKCSELIHFFQQYLHSSKVTRM